ncbi:MAG: Bax inhibitor-1/YccA family protein [Defluviitaleaceae bacterium]|nr:Bax inhibitor-1/YccA family protein [Defluviitaleaceae bacterium]
MWEQENAQQTQQPQQAEQGYYQEEQYVDIGMVEADAVNAYMARVFGWMFIGLLVTALTTVGILWGINNVLAFEDFLFWNLGIIMIVAIVVELILVVTISSRVTKMNPFTAKFCFILYAALNGLTFGFVALMFAYTVFDNPMQTVGMAFGITSVAFGAMAIFGMITKTDLTRFGNLFFMGLMGLVIASVANWFVGGAMLDLAIIVFGLFLFMGLTAYHSHNIKHHYAQIALSENGAEAVGARVDQQGLASNLAITGALTLYLAFINMFMFILRLLARRN